MDILSWMTSLLAVATFVLAGMAYWAIRQNYSFQRRERREKILDEIIEWANDVNTQVCDYKLLTQYFTSTMINISLTCLGLSNKGRFIKSIAEKALNSETLNKSISDTAQALGVYGASLKYLADGVERGEFLMMDITEEQKDKYTKDLDMALASYKNHKDINEFETITGKLEENMRGKAIKTLDICV